MRRSQNFARTQKGGKRGKIFTNPINQFIKGFTSSLVVNSYISANLEDKQFYFSLDIFSIDGSLNLGCNLRFKCLAGATPWFYLKLKL